MLRCDMRAPCAAPACCARRDAEGLYLGFRELSYCTLRAQLLMALHDDNSAVATRDQCHELAWTLDAGIMNGAGRGLACTAKQMLELVVPVCAPHHGSMNSAW